MTKPYLIAHKVRGEPAFDIAERMRCPICDERGEFFQRPDCNECDGEGFWWILSSGGWRAHPYWHCELNLLIKEIDVPLSQIPEDWPDLFSVNDRKHVSLNLDEYGISRTEKDREAGRNLLATLGMLREKPKLEPLKRRI